MNKKYVPFKFTPVVIDGLKFKNVQYHRNGVSGEPFFCAVVHDKENGDMLITYFQGMPELCCAVYKFDLFPDITFGVNSWRGDNYNKPMDKAIVEYQRQYDEWLAELNKVSA